MFKLSTQKAFTALLLVILFAIKSNAQQLKITDFVIFGGQSNTSLKGVTTPPSPGFAVNLSSSTNITTGRIGSYNLIKSTGNTTIGGNLNSGGTINLSNSAKISGSITVQNQGKFSGNVLQMGSNAFVKYNIDAAGNIYITNGTVSGNVTHPAGTTYHGPKPGGKEIINTPTIPTLPNLPVVTNFTTQGTNDITSSKTITPGNYRDMKLNGNQKVTFSGPGDYYFKSIHNKNSNTLEFDFKNTTTGNIRIFVSGDVELDKGSSTLKNGGSATRIFLEVHGTGSTCSNKNFSFTISNGSSNCTSWLGTVWAPYAAINIGSGKGSGAITGAFWSTTQVNIQSGVTVNFAPFAGLTSNADTLILPGYDPPANGKSTDIVGPELMSLCQTFGNGSTPSTDIYQVFNDSVLIEVTTIAGYYNNALSILTTKYGMTDLIDNGPNSVIITGKIPINQLCPLNNDPDLKNYIISCRPLYPAITSTGLATTGGDTAMHADIVRNDFHLTGDGIKVGIISDGYNTIPGNPAATDIANGDLPGVGNPNDSVPVDVLLDYPYGRTTDEGRAMLQTVHDIAPKASLAFRTGFISEGDFAQGIYEMQQAGCNVIADDITYITTPFFKDGLAAQAVNSVKAKGVSYFSAAGNFADKSYEAVFNPTAPPQGFTGQAHNFGGGDIFQNDSLQPGSYTIVLQWEDSIYSLGQGGAKNDFDIYLMNDDGSILFGMNRLNIGGDPVEVLPFTVKGNTRTNIMIVRAAGSSPNVRIKFIVYRGNLTFNEYKTGTSTLVGQANAAGAMAVAAARYTNTPAYGVNPPLIETFSSLGGTPVNGVVRNKPDFTAPDGGNTTVNFNSLDLENDGIPNFFGTSAAAPHAAAVAALILQGKKLFYNKVLEPDSVRIILSNTAIDMNTPGFDNTSGFGLIQANAAVSSFAAPTPELDSLLISVDSSALGKNTFTATLKGKYFQPNTIVTLRGVPVPTAIVNSTEVTAVIPPFVGNPPVQAYTPPITPSGLDGSYSDSLYFFSHIKKQVVIIANNQTKRFGEKLPVFTSSVFVDGEPIDSSGLSLSDLNLDTLLYTSSATSTSNVGLYYIRPAFKTLTSADSLAFELYNYTFVDGVLFNNRMSLIITPRDTTVTYGSKLTGFNFNYTYDDSLIAESDKASFLNNIKMVHDSSIDNSVTAFVDGKSIVNGRTLADSDLLNMSVMASGKSIVNGRSIVNGKSIVNGIEVTDTTKVVDLALQSIFDYQIDSSSSPLISANGIVNGRSIVNAKSIVNGTAEVNGKSIVNGNPVLNSNSVGDTSNTNVVVIIDEDDVNSDTNTISDIKSVNMITGITAGDYRVVPAAMISENFELNYGLGDLTILPTTLMVKARDTSIYQGYPLPKFAADITGLKDEDTIVSGPTYIISPQCYGNAGTYKIIPSNLVTECAGCYVTTYSSGTLYINPKGKYTKNIKPKLVCVDTLINDASGLKYVATFGYTNSNNTTEFIAPGPDNNISGDGAATAIYTLPQIFLPGSNNTFQVKFNGKKITWTIKSYNGSQKVSASQDASSASPRCNNHCGNNSFATSATLQTQGNIVVSPNPTQGKFVVSISKGIISPEGLYVSDITGKKYNVHISQISSTSLQVELPVVLVKGVYLVSVKIDDKYTVARVLKF